MPQSLVEAGILETCSLSMYWFSSSEVLACQHGTVSYFCFHVASMLLIILMQSEGKSSPSGERWPCKSLRIVVLLFPSLTIYLFLTFSTVITFASV